MELLVPSLLLRKLEKSRGLERDIFSLLHNNSYDTDNNYTTNLTAIIYTCKN